MRAVGGAYSNLPAQPQAKPQPVAWLGSVIDANDRRGLVALLRGSCLQCAVEVVLLCRSATMASLNHMYTQPRAPRGNGVAAAAATSYHIETDETREKQRKAAQGIQHRLRARGLTEQQQRQCGAPHKAGTTKARRGAKQQRPAPAVRHATETHNHLGVADADGIFLDGIAAAAGDE